MAKVMIPSTLFVAAASTKFFGNILLKTCSILSNGVFSTTLGAVPTLESIPPISPGLISDTHRIPDAA